MAPQEQVVEVNLQQHPRRRVVVTPGTAQVKLTFDRIAINTDSDGKVFKYDTQGSGENLKYPLSLYQAIIGQSAADLLR